MSSVMCAACKHSTPYKWKCSLHLSLHHLHKANDLRVMDVDWDVWLTPGYTSVSDAGDVKVGKDVGVKVLPKHGARHTGKPLAMQ